MIAAAKGIADIGTQLNGVTIKTGWLKKIVDGDQGLDAFINELCTPETGFVWCMSDFVQQVNDRIPDNLKSFSSKSDAITAAAQGVANIASSLNGVTIEESWISKFDGDSSFVAFCNYIADDQNGFVAAMGSYYDAVTAMENVSTKKSGNDSFETKSGILVGAVQAVANIAGSLSGVQIAPNLVQRIGVLSNSSFETFCKDIGTKFVPAIVSFKTGLESDEFGSIDITEVENNADKAVAIANKVIELARSMTYSDGTKIEWTGGIGSIINGGSSFSAFCGTLPDFSTNIMDFVDGIGGLSSNYSDVVKEGGDFDTAMDLVGRIAKFMADLSDEDSEYGNIKVSTTGILSIWSGTNTPFQEVLNSLNWGNARKIVQFMNGLKGLTKVADEYGMTTLDKADVAFEVLGKVATFIAEMNKTLNTVSSEYGDGDDEAASVISGIFGANLQTYMTELGELAPIISELIPAIDSITTDNSGDLDSRFTSLETFLKNVATFFEDLSDPSKFPNLMNTSPGTAYDPISNFSDYLGGLITAINTSGEQLTDNVNATALYSAMSQITDFANLISGQGSVKLDSSEMVASLKDEDIETLRTFADNAASAATYGSDTMSGALQDYSDAGTNLANSFSTSVKDSSSSASSAGESLIASFSKAVESNGTLTSAGSKAAKKAVAGLNSKKKDFVAAGNYAAQGFAQGILDKKDTVTAAGTAIGEYALEAAKAAIDSNSPSKKFMELGMWADKGLAIGLSDYSDCVTKASSCMAEDSLATTKDTLKALASTVVEDVDSEPTIRPVVDLSSVSKGASEISSLLAKSHSVDVGISSSLAASAAKSLTSKNQNGSTENNYNNQSYGGLNFSGAVFNVRSDNDIRALAKELSNLNMRELQARGVIS